MDWRKLVGAERTLRGGGVALESVVQVMGLYTEDSVRPDALRIPPVRSADPALHHAVVCGLPQVKELTSGTGSLAALPPRAHGGADRRPSRREYFDKIKPNKPTRAAVVGFPFRH